VNTSTVLLSVIPYVIVVPIVLRWPGRTAGLAIALTTWTVLGESACWIVLVITTVGSISWAKWGPDKTIHTESLLLRMALATAATAALTGSNLKAICLLVPFLALAWIIRSQPA
jgi:hypothetical protein